MRKTAFKGIFLAIGLALLGTTLSACEKKDGPMEEIGEEIDEAIDNAKDAVD